MGMYTTLFCLCDIKEEYERELTLLSKAGWQWEHAITEELRDFGYDRRSGFVTGKCLGNHKWTFEADLKNYDDTLEEFIQTVLSLICKKIYKLETLYEEDMYPTVYIMKNGKIVED